MWKLFLCLLVALTASESPSYEPSLNYKKTYQYKYEGMVQIGRELADQVQSAVKLRCTFKIIGETPQTFVFQTSDIYFEDFNGITGKSDFNSSEKLTKRLSAEFSQPIGFMFSKGQVTDIRTAPGVSNTVVNIVRGMLGFLQVTVKTTQSVYELVEMGIHGVCQSSYTVEEDTTSKDLMVTQMVDINNCQQPAALSRGMALAPEDKISKQKGDHVVSTVKHFYTVKPTADGGLITKALSKEHQYFSPLNVKGGNSRLFALREIELLNITDTTEKVVTEQLQSRGNLVYKADKSLNPIPVVMIDLNEPVPKILELIKRLAEANVYQVDSSTTTEILDLIQLLRMVPVEDLEQLWEQVSGDDELRRWFLDMVVEVTDERILKFLEARFKAEDITANEAGQALVVAFNHLSAEPVSVVLAQEFLNIPFSKSHPLLWNTVVLAYGSLLHRYCVYTDPCPVTVVQPLLDLAASALIRKSENDMVLALKALGNAAHRSSIKTILKFLPGHSAEADKLSTRVHGTAVQAFRLLAIKDPHSVQDAMLSVFVQKNLQPEIRMLAIMMLLETKPPIALLSLLSEALLVENNYQVASFSYSLIRSFAKSKTPDNQHLSTACNIAMKLLSPRLGFVSYRYSKNVHFEWFHDEHLFGMTTDMYLLQNESPVPTQLVFKEKLHFIGRILQFLELGVRMEGIKELFAGMIPRLSKQFGVNDLATLKKILSDWQNFPKDRPLLSAYARVFGQEAFYIDVDGDLIQKILKSFSPLAGKESTVWENIQDLQKGTSWHWTKPHLVYEARFIQPTSLGLPVEISKYYSIVNAVTMNAKAEINPEPQERLAELFSSDISLHTDGFVGVTKDHFIFHGINTDLFQCGSEVKTKMSMSLPWSFDTKFNIKDQKYEMNFSPITTVTELFSFNSDVFSVSRNIEDLSSHRMTRMMPETQSSENDLARKLFAVYRDENNENQVEFKQCAEAKIYGTALCVEAETRRSHYPHQSPLYFYQGYTSFSVQLEPVKDRKPIDEIQIHVNAFKKHHSVVSGIVDLRRRFKDTRNESSSYSEEIHQPSSFTATQVLSATPDPVVSVKALAVSSAASPLGYESVAFYLPSAQRDDFEIIVSEVGETANWKMCANANRDKSRSSVKAHLRWGAECQTYDMSVKVSTTCQPESKPALHSKISWVSLPPIFLEIGQEIEEYLPGMFYLTGFYQKHEANPERQASITFTVTSPESFDVKMKIPERTIYRKTIPSPVQLVGFETTNITVTH